MLETERLVLRPPTVEDADALEPVFGDAEVMRFVAAGRPLARPELEALVARMVERFATDGFGQFVVQRRADGHVVGRVGLLPLDPQTWEAGTAVALGARAELEIGWTLARAEWGHGYAFEAASAVRAFAAETLGRSRLVSIVQNGNDRSVRLVERLGGRPERRIVTSFGKQATVYGYTLGPVASGE